MLRGGRRLRGFVSILLILSSMYLVAQPASAESKLSETRRKLHATRAKLAEIRQDDAALLAVIRQLGGQLSTVRVALRNAEAVLARIEATIGGQERRLAALEADRRERAAIVNERARTLYMMGPSIEAEALLSSHSISEFIERTESLDQAMRSDRVLMDDLARISDQATKTKALLSRERIKAAAIRRAVAERAAELGEILAVKQEAEGDLGNQISAY
ncbi:MAG: PcsB-like coiled-coil domain-containing protein, partial [Actinomycetota bacterium]